MTGGNGPALAMGGLRYPTVRVEIHDLARVAGHSDDRPFRTMGLYVQESLVSVTTYPDLRVEISIHAPSDADLEGIRDAIDDYLERARTRHEVAGIVAAAE